MPMRSQLDPSVYQGFYNNQRQTSIADVMGAVQGIRGMVADSRMQKKEEELNEDDRFLNDVYARNFSDWDGRDPAEFQRRKQSVNAEIQKTKPKLFGKSLGMSKTIEDAMNGRIEHGIDIDGKILDNEKKEIEVFSAQQDFNRDFLKDIEYQQGIVGKQFALVAEGKQGFSDAVQKIKSLGVDARLPTEEQFNQNPLQFYDYLVAQKMQNDEKMMQLEQQEKELGIKKSESDLSLADRLNQAKVNQMNRSNQKPDKSEMDSIDPGTGRPYTQQQNKTAAFAVTMGRGIGNIDKLIKNGFDEADFVNQVMNTFKKKKELSRMQFMNLAKTPEQRQYLQAQLDFMIPHLRDQSGAVINADEYTTEAMQYFPITGDGNETVQQKKSARRQEFINKRTVGGNRYKQMISEFESELKALKDAEADEEASTANSYLEEIRARRAASGSK